MVKNDQLEIAAIEALEALDEMEGLLARWHSRDSGMPINGTDRLADPTFDRYQSYRGWDDEYALNEAELWSDKLKTLDFEVSGNRGQGGMQEPYRSAIYELARNLCAGCSVWRSPRLPKDPMERAQIVMDARDILARRLIKAGVLSQQYSQQYCAQSDFLL